jgi:hypothetical protein
MTLLRQKSSRSLRGRARPQTQPLEHSVPVSPPMPLPSPSTSRTLEVRLGHPSRPYYTAIRKNMSSSPSPTQSCFPRDSSSWPLSTSASPLLQIPRSNPATPTCPNMSGRGAHSLSISKSSENEGTEDDSPAMHPRSHRSLPTPHSPWLATAGVSLSSVSTSPRRVSNANGFSLSGEAELRIALSRVRSSRECRSDDEYDNRGEYRFRERTVLVRTGGRGRERVGGKVRRIGKGIKELVFGCERGQR